MSRLHLAAAAACAACACAAPATAAEPGRDTELLRRHAPVLVLDRQERFPPAPVEAALPPGGRPSGDRVDIAAGDRPPAHAGPLYARVVREDGRPRWLQYWAFYLHNPQDRGILRTGRHEGDWELVQIGLGVDARPEHAVYAQHANAERCAWEDVRRSGERPLVYVANGSHAAFFRPGTHRGRIFPDPVDEAGGDGRVLRPRVVDIGSAAPAWVAWPGRWGASRGGIVPGEQASPRGPAFQDGGRWSDPAAFAASAGSCTAACGGAAACRPLAVLAARNWPLGLLGLAAAVTAAAVRRRRAPKA